MTEFEKRMMAEGRCIVCGQPATSRVVRGVEMRLKECTACWRRGRGGGEPPAYESCGGADVGSEYRRRMGYSAAAGSAPTRGDK